VLSCIVPRGVRKVADRYKALFADSALRYPALCALLALYLLGCNGLSEVVRACPWAPSVSSLSRAVADFDGNRFMRRLRASILRRYKERLKNGEFVFAVDDTDNPKYGREIFAVGRWSGSKGRYIGQKVLVVALVDMRRGVALPLAFGFARKKADPGYVSLIDQAAALLGDCIAEGFPPLPVACDSWFDSSALMLSLDRIGLTYAGELKSNRRVRANAAPHARRSKLADFFESEHRHGVLASPNTVPKRKQGRPGRPRRKAIAERVAMINGYPSPVKIVAVYDNPREPRPFAYYVSTDRLMTGARLWAISRARWAIEVLFRDLKQNLSFGRLPCKGQQAADLAVCLPLALYVSLKDEASEVWGTTLTGGASLGALVRSLRQRMLDRSIALIAGNPGHGVVERLRARRCVERLTRKPRNEPAASRSDGESHAQCA
jgi:hypothetical protein